jgi:hypothetical protein
MKGRMNMRIGIEKILELYFGMISLLAVVVAIFSLGPAVTGCELNTDATPNKAANNDSIQSTISKNISPALGVLLYDDQINGAPLCKHNLRHAMYYLKY